MKTRMDMPFFSRAGLFVTAVFMLVSFVAVAFIAMALYWKIKGQQRLISMEQTVDLASNYGNLIKNSIEKDLTLTQTLANHIGNYEEVPVEARRACFKAIHKVTFLNNPQLYNLFTICEPNSIDDRDKEGERFYYSTFRLDTGAYHEKHLIYYNVDSTWWYNTPRKIMEDYISEPYYWRYPDKPDSVFEISIISPIISKGRFMGVVGIDKRLDELQRELSSIRPFDSGFVFLLSNDGVLVSYPDEGKIGKRYDLMLEEDRKELVGNCLRRGRNESFLFVDSLQHSFLTTLYPVKFGRSNKYWAIGVSIPDEVALKPFSQKAIAFFIIGSGILFVVIFSMLILWNFSLNKKVEEKTEEIKHALQKAEESSSLKSAFLGNISHEIRTPLNGIMGFTELLATEELESEKKLEFNAIVQKSGYHLLHTIDNIIDISKIESDQLEIVKAPNNIVEMVDGIVGDIKAGMVRDGIAKDVTFAVRIDIPKGQTSIDTDTFRLKQALENVLDNALKFTSKGTVTLLAEVRYNNLVFVVTDTGKGIPEERLKVIFDSFRQGSEDYMNPYNYGTGLGLSIAKGIITLLKGDIRIESDVDKGTKVSIFIPLQ